MTENGKLERYKRIESIADEDITIKLSKTQKEAVMQFLWGAQDNLCLFEVKKEIRNEDAASDVLAIENMLDQGFRKSRQYIEERKEAERKREQEAQVRENIRKRLFEEGWVEDPGYEPSGGSSFGS